MTLRAVPGTHRRRGRRRAGTRAVSVRCRSGCSRSRPRTSHRAAASCPRALNARAPSCGARVCRCSAPPPRRRLHLQAQRNSKKKNPPRAREWPTKEVKASGQGLAQGECRNEPVSVQTSPRPTFLTAITHARYSHLSRPDQTIPALRSESGQNHPVYRRLAPAPCRQDVFF